LAGTILIFGFLGATFFGGKSKKAGEGAFDVDKPQSVQNSMDKADQSRLSRFQASNNNNK
jgi:hypothetical protein